MNKQQASISKVSLKFADEDSNALIFELQFIGAGWAGYYYREADDLRWLANLLRRANATSFHKLRGLTCMVELEGERVVGFTAVEKRGE